MIWGEYVGFFDGGGIRTPMFLSGRLSFTTVADGILCGIK